MINKFLKFWPLGLIIVLTFILRVVRIEELFYFTYDESIPAFVGRNFYTFGKLPLIGGVTPFGFHLTPYFYWLLSFIISISKLNPTSWGIAGALLSTFTTFAIYKVGITFFNKKVGFFAAILWAFSYLANIYDRHFWALWWGPLICLATLYSLAKIIKGEKIYVFLLGVILIWSITTDPSNLVFIFLATLVYIFCKIRISKPEVAILLVTLFSLLPLIIFDLRHNFANTKPLVNYLSSDKSTSRFQHQDFFDRTSLFSNSLARLIYPTSDNEIAKQYSYCSVFIEEKYERIPILVKFVSILAILGFLYISLKSKNRVQRLVSLTIMIYFLGIQGYGILANGDIFEHYLTGLFPIFLLIVAYYLGSMPKKLSFFIISTFLILNLYKLAIAENSHGFKFKREGINYATRELNGSPFSLESLSTCWRYSGYRYLFAAFGKEPIKSYVDPNLGHLYGTTSIAKDHPDTVVVFVTHDFKVETDDFYRKYALYKSHELKSDIFANIEVIIMDNQSKWF